MTAQCYKKATTKKEIMLQLLKGVSWNDTARSLRCSKATVARCAAKMEEEGIDSTRLEAMTDAEVSGLFADGRGRRGEEHLEPDYARVCDQLARVPKMALALQWARYTDCNPGGKRPYGYSGFCRKVGEYARSHDLVARIAHEPGRTMLVDWAGITASVFDPVTGRRSPAYLFVASFPWSSWACAECFPDMRTRSRAAAHVHALRAAGGVPDIIVPDSCATATDRGRRPGPVKVKDAYLEMAEHYGCAVVPARVRRPRGKASAEKAVDLCETWVPAPLAGERLTSLDELNAEVRRLVDALNARPFSRREGCRDNAFFGEERAVLNPLPEAPFEWCEWRRSRCRPTTTCSATTCAARCRTAWSAGPSTCASAPRPWRRSTAARPWPSARACAAAGAGTRPIPPTCRPSTPRRGPCGRASGSSGAPGRSGPKR